MTIEQLHTDEEFRRHEFPIARQKIYLGHAGVCPLPRRVQQSISEYADGCTLADQEFVMPAAWLRETRQLTADFLGVKLEEVAFVGPTSLGLSFVAHGLRFRKNQNVVVYHDDYPSNVYPWMTLADRGVEVRFLNIRELGCIRPRDVLGQVDENTRLVALASCHFLAGYRIDLDEIGRGLRERGILFCLDAIQTLGAFETSLRYVDFAAADAHKWLLGPCGSGIFYVRREVQDELEPVAQGWHNVRCPNFVTQDDVIYKSDARRYEAGTHNLLGVVGLRAGIELLTEVGVNDISRELLRKRSWLIPALQQKGYSVQQASTPPQNAGGMITFHRADASMAELHAKLEQNGVVVSLRADRKNQQYLRFAPHFYNTDAEMHRVLALL
jgi:cysteine desulfurase / selenocysteine lyase